MTPIGTMAALGARIRAVFRRNAFEREMREEMERHLDAATARLIRRGLSESEARLAARREFGNIGALEEEARDARGGRWVEALIADVRYAFRHFRRTPLTAATLIIVLSLGIGVNSALFSIMQSLTLRPAPGVPADDALVRIRGTTFSRVDGERDGRGLSMPEINDLATHREMFAAVAAYTTDDMVVDPGDGSDARVINGQFVTPNFFATLGVRPVIGPGLPAGRTDDAPGADMVAVIGHRLWEQLGADSATIGRVLRINTVPVRVLGVAPPGFAGPTFKPGGSRPSLWLPLAARAPIDRTTAHALVSRDSMMLDAMARLAPGTTLEQANALVRVVAATWAPAPLPSDEAKEYSSDVVPARGFTDVTNDGETAAIIALTSAGALLILLVVCTNVSALLVGAAVARRREIAIRLSLGASRSRVVRQLTTESSLIATAGGALGLATYWAITRVITWLFADVPLGPDLGTVAFTAFFALGTGIAFGLSPALHATRLDVSSALKASGGGASSRSRLQRGFIVAQIVLTQPLLVGIAMVIGIVLSEFRPAVDDALSRRIVRVQFGIDGGAGSRDDKVARIAEAMGRVSALPGVDGVVPQAAAFAIGEWRVHRADRGAGPHAQETVRANLEGAPPGYFAFQQIPMLRGRELVVADTAGREMAVVIANDLARGFWGTADPVGKRLEMISRRNTEARTAVVVGVFDTTGTPLRGAGRVYTADGARWRKDTYLVRTRGAGSEVVPSIRQLARTALPDVPVYGNGIATLEQLQRLERRDVLTLSATAVGGGLIALMLASIGLYGVVALAVRQRHREIGVRVALGALPRQVIRLFFMSGVRLGVVGVVLGLPLSVVALYGLTTTFNEQVPVDMTLVGVGIAMVVVGVAALASWLPARRAALVDPLVAIRAE